MAEELSCLRPSTRLGFQSFGFLRPYGPCGNEGVGAPVNNGEHVCWFAGLRITMASMTSDHEADGLQSLDEPSRQPRIVNEVRHHGVDGALERVKAVDRDCCSQVIAIKDG